MTTSRVLLVPGFWLGAWAWEQVEERLHELGHHTMSLTLPGLDPHDPERATLTPLEQANAIIQAIDENAVIVAHSGANIPTTLAMDMRPDLIEQVIWVDSGPVGDGSVFNADAPQDLMEFPLPDFDVLGDEASLAGLDQDILDQFRRRAVPEPGAILTTPLALNNEARYAIPTTLVCNSLPSDQLMTLAEAGHPLAAELSKYSNLSTVDLPTGHWPMWSSPRALAEIISQAVST